MSYLKKGIRRPSIKTIKSKDELPTLNEVVDMSNLRIAEILNATEEWKRNTQKQVDEWKLVLETNYNLLWEEHLAVLKELEEVKKELELLELLKSKETSKPKKVPKARRIHYDD